MDKLVIAGREFDSRLLVGTGKFASPQVMAQALAACGAEIVTVALRRVDIGNPQDDTLREIDREQVPAACRTLPAPGTRKRRCDCPGWPVPRRISTG